MPNYLLKNCAISLQSFATGCKVCSCAFLFFAPGPVDLFALCAGSGIAQKRQKNAEGLGRRSAFFLGRAAVRRGKGQGVEARAQVGRISAEGGREHARSWLEI